MKRAVHHVSPDIIFTMKLFRDPGAAISRVPMSSLRTYPPEGDNQTATPVKPQPPHREVVIPPRLK